MNPQGQSTYQKKIRRGQMYGWHGHCSSIQNIPTSLAAVDANKREIRERQAKREALWNR